MIASLLQQRKSLVYFVFSKSRRYVGYIPCSIRYVISIILRNRTVYRVDLSHANTSL